MLSTPPQQPVSPSRARFRMQNEKSDFPKRTQFPYRKNTLSMRMPRSRLAARVTMDWCPRALSGEPGHKPNFFNELACPDGGLWSPARRRAYTDALGAEEEFALLPKAFSIKRSF